MKRILKVLLGVVVALVVAGVVWWHFFRITPEQRAQAKAADAILNEDGQGDDDLGDLGDEMQELGVSAGDEAEADEILDELLDE